jgi:hypothetical protein
MSAYQPLDIEEQPAYRPDKHKPFSCFGLSRRSLTLLVGITAAGLLVTALHTTQASSIGSRTWLAQYPEFVHGPAPLQVRSL